MFTYRSKTYIGAIFFQFVILYNILINFIINTHIIPLSVIILLISIIFNAIGVVKFNRKAMSIGLVLNILFIPFSSVFSIFVIPTTIILIIGFIRQQKRINLFEEHNSKKLDDSIEDQGEYNYGQ